MPKPKKSKRNLAAAKLADALEQIADSDREKILDRLQTALDSARKTVLGSFSKGRRNAVRKKPRKKKAKR